MPENMIGEIRRSAVLMTYAPGAVMDMRAEGAPVSAVSAGLEEWDQSAPLEGNLKYQKIVERRLCKKLGKKYFRLPPVLAEDAKIPGTERLDPSALVARRFPQWLLCPMCEIMRPASKWGNDPGRASRYCTACTQKQPGGKKVFAVPVRFAAACNAGHLSEFPWHFWLRHATDCIKKDELKLSSEGAGLAGLIVSCPACKKRRSLDGAFSKRALAGLKCQGKRPWLRTDDPDCECTGEAGTYRAVQRGASNLYYPVIESALDIPPWTRRLERVLGDYWDMLADIPLLEDRIKYIPTSVTLTEILKRENLTARELAERFEQMQKDLDAANVEDLRPDEYRVFVSGGNELEDEFETFAEEVPSGLTPYFARIVRVARLREVRVVRGFTRINPPFDSNATEGVAPISGTTLDWLPAIEVRGEGIFLQFHAERLAEWEAVTGVSERCAVAGRSWAADWESRNQDKPKPFEASPRRLLIHTFAHALIRQLTLECGYSSSSLRERLYVAEGESGMAGLLIYTATPDSDGTLGGLQRRAMPDLLGPTVEGALRSTRWCSSDPLCIEGEMAAPESHSLASCHACTMVPETSCELHNRFLDRALLIGTDAQPGLGYFRPMVDKE